MTRGSSGLAGGFLLAAAAALLAIAAASKPTGAAAEAAVVAWLDGLGERGLVIEQEAKDDAFVVSHGDSAVGRITRFEFRRDGWWVAFTFKGEHGKDATAEALRRNFWHATLDEMPTPGLDLPGWRVRPLTPTSSIEEGVEVVACGDGRARFRVRTRCFAIDGRDPSVKVPADAPAPPGSFFQVRRGFPLDLTLDAPIR